MPIQCSVSLLPNGGKMLLGTDIEAVLTTLTALDVDVIGLNCSTGPEDMRDAIRYLGENCPVPVHCIPNAGIPFQGPDGETIFPAEPEPLADVLPGVRGEERRVDRGRLLRHHARAHPAIVDRVGGQAGRAAARARRARWSRSHDERDPAGPGARAHHRRRARELAGLAQGQGDAARPTTTTACCRSPPSQVEGGAHVLDLCVALTEREDEDEQMRQLAKRVSLSLPAPLQIDSTEPEVMKLALEQTPGRAIVNSVNLEAGRDKLDTVVPLAKAHGAALIALTIDEVGMAKTRDRKVEIAQRIRDMVCDEHGLDEESLIFDVADLHAHHR